MKKAIIFGAGTMGPRVLQRFSATHEITAFSDNDVRKQGQMLCGLPVLPPGDLLLQANGMKWDIIIISTISGAIHIRRQLTEELGIPSDKIIEDPMHITLNMARRNALKNARELLELSGPIGSAAEVGVYQGEFAAAINEVFPESTLYLFDTFEGMASEEETMKLMPYPEKCVIKKGFFPDTAVGIDEQFSFVSLDVNQYHPTIEGLKFFYPKMKKGGYIFMHDYFYTTNRGVIDAFKEFSKTTPLHTAPLGDGCSIVLVK